MKSTQFKLPEGKDLAYFAGIFDGEGNIYIQRSHVIQITTTSEELKLWLLWNIGGVCCTYHDGNDTHKRVYKWRVIRKADVIALATAVLPYCVVKQRELRVFLNSML